MTIMPHFIKNLKIAEIDSENMLIHSAQDGLEILGDLYFQGFHGVIIHEHNITSDFFNLQNGIAGEMLQKFSNYRVRLTIVGDFSKYTSRSFNDFMHESNKGRLVSFVPTIADALNSIDRNL